MRGAALVLCVVLTCTTTLAQQPAPPPTSALTGFVRSAIDGRPLRRARVEVTAGSRRFEPVLTDDEGRFTVDLAGTGPFTVTAEKAGYAVLQASVPREAFASPVVLRLERGAAISGVAVDADGRPQPSMAVTVRRLGSERPAPGAQAQFRTVTDDRGEYRVGGLAPGSYELRAGYGITRVTVLRTGSTQQVIATTTAGAMVLEGVPGSAFAPDGPPQVVTLDGGDDVTGVQLSVSTIDSSARDEVLRTIVESRGLPASRVPDVGELPRGAAAGIRGRVITDAGEAVAAAGVRIFGSGFDQIVRTDAGGRFSLFGLRAGQYLVEADRSGYATRQYGQSRAGQPGRPIALAADETIEIELVLARGSVVTGVVVDEHGEPLQGVRMRALRLQYSAGRMTAVPAGADRRTDDRGHYRVSNLLPGTYVIAATIDGTLSPSRSGAAYAPMYFPGTPALAAALPIVLDADAVADLVYTPTAGARVTGRARDGDGPLVSGRVRLVESRRSGIVSLEPVTAPVQPDGTFTFPNVPAGEYVLQVLGDGPGRTGLFGVQTVSVAEGDSVDLTVRTSHGTTLEGRITLDGVPEPPSCVVSIRDGATISAPCEGEEPAARLGLRLVPVALDDRARADPPGTFVVSGNTFYLTGLFGPTAFALERASDEWYLKSLVVRGSDIADTGFDFGASGGTVSEVEIVFSRNGAAVEGRLTDGSAPTSDYSVVVFPAYRDQWMPRSRRMKFTRARGDGSFRLAALPAGDYLVAAVDRLDGTADGGDWQNPDVLEQLAPRAERLSLSEGQSRTLTLRLLRR